MANNKRSIFRKVYFPGLISLVFLPIISIVYFLHEGKLTKLYATDVVWADEEFMNFQGSKFNIDKIRHYNNTVLTGNSTLNKVLLDSVKHHIKKLQTKLDTVNGFSIEFTNHTKYEDIVNALDVRNQIDFIKVGFIAYKNKIYIIGINWHRYDKVPLIDLSNDIVIPEKKPLTIFERFDNGIERLKYQLFEDVNYLIAFWPPFVIVIGLFVLSVFKGRSKSTI